MGGDVSVVITTHYRNGPLRTAIESVLAQTHEPREVLVVDDSGEHHAEPVVEEYDVRYLGHEENRGQIAGWHGGAAATEGAYVQLLDDDDHLHEGKLAAQVELLEERSAGVAYCGFEWTDGERVVPPPEGRGDVLDRALTLEMPACTTSTLLVERSLLERVFPLPSYRGGTDVPLKIELAARSAYEYVDRPLVYRRRSPGSQRHSDAAMRTRRRVLDEYASLYEDAPASVQQRAAATAYRLTATTALRGCRWSPRAVLYYAKAGLANPDTRRRDLARSLLAVLGRPGITAGGYAADAVRSLLGESRTPETTETGNHR